MFIVISITAVVIFFAVREVEKTEKNLKKISKMKDYDEAAYGWIKGQHEGISFEMNYVNIAAGGMPADVKRSGVAGTRFTFEIGDELPGDLQIYVETSVVALTKAFGLPDFKTGNEKFDQQFVVRGSNKSAVLEYLTINRMNALLNLIELSLEHEESHTSVQVKNNKLTVIVYGHLEKENEISSKLKTFSQYLRALQLSKTEKEKFKQPTYQRRHFHFGMLGYWFLTAAIVLMLLGLSGHLLYDVKDANDYYFVYQNFLIPYSVLVSLFWIFTFATQKKFRVAYAIYFIMPVFTVLTYFSIVGWVGYYNCFAVPEANGQEVKSGRLGFEFE